MGIREVAEDAILLDVVNHATRRYTVADAVCKLTEHELSWPGRSLFPASGLPGKPPASIDAPFLYALCAEDWAEELSRREWLEDIRTRLGLVTIDGGPPRPRRREDDAWIWVPPGGMDLVWAADCFRFTPAATKQVRSAH